MSNIKPKILIFSLTYLPYVGGAEVAVKEITARLKDDFSFDLITARLDKKLDSFETIGSVNIYRVGRGSIFDKYLYPQLALKKAQELARDNYYLVNWGVLEFWGGWAALKFKEKFPKIKYLLTMQSGDSEAFVKLRTWFWWWRYKQIFLKANYIQAISQWLTNRAVGYGYKGQIEVVPNGVDTTVNKNQLTVNNLKNKLNITDEKIILSVSRLVEKNGVEDLIRGFQVAVNKYQLTNIKLLIVGDGKLKDKLVRLAARLGLAEKIIFVGHVKPEEVGAYYQIADVFVRPSLSEGLGNVFLEAMASNVPVIATPVGGIPDFLQDGETGWFCQASNPESIAEKISYILDKKNNVKIQRVVANARQMITERYSWAMVAGKMKIIFEKIQNLNVKSIPND